MPGASAYPTYPTHENELAAMSEAVQAFGSTAGMLWQLFVFVVATVFVLFLAYYSLRLLGGARNMRKSGNLSIIEAANVGFQNNIALIRAGEQYFLIGVSRGRVTLIGEVDSASIKEPGGLSPNAIPFESHLKRIFKRDANDGDDPNALEKDE